MAKKKEEHEDHVDETWLIPYADMLTLLLALFIVMFAMSEIDKEKFKQLSNSFNTVFSGGSGIHKAESKTIDIKKAPVKVIINNAKIEADLMLKVKQDLEAEIEKKGYSDKVKVVLNSEGLEISIQDVALFKSGDANVLEQISPLLIQICNLLHKLKNDIKIIGHTDNVPIMNSQFRSNWDLSAIRAINVMNFMVIHGGVQPNRFAVEAYGEYKPKYSNSTLAGRDKNRRVEIFLKRINK